MDIMRRAATASRKGLASRFTGEVWQDPVIEAPEPATIRSVNVSFAPGARTAWHTHPRGQTLYIVSGVARVQAWGGPVRELHAGDVCFFAPDEKHWHGAAPNHFMVHLAMQEAVNGEHVTWLEHVTDEQYAVAPTA